METPHNSLPLHLFFPPKPQCLMTQQIAVKPLLRRLTATAFRLFSTASAAGEPELATISNPPSPSRRSAATRDSKKVNFDSKQLKLNWLESLTCPSTDSHVTRDSKEAESGSDDSGWVIGVDPDLSGALAVIKPDNSPQIFDSPHLKLLVGKRLRKRLDVKSMIQLIRNVDAPIGTTAYIEQSIPYPQDGKQGWWSGGFGYGLWIGILVASGYSVVPVPSLAWKNEYKLAGSRSSKDDSRELASTLFPCTSSLLKRKKDHGRAEALLIAAYGKGLKVKPDSSCIIDELMP